MSSNLILILITCPSDNAEKIAETLVNEKLAACVNITQVKSIYIWRDKLNRDDEALLVAKTRDELYGKLEKRVKEIHPYDVPEIVVVETFQVEHTYLSWVFKQVL